MVIFFSTGVFAEVRRVIKSWKPRGCKTEKDYEKSLRQKLEKELKNRKIQRQFGAARQRVDIVVDGKVPIEIKKDLNSTAALQRTIGQLDQYLEDWPGVFLVLCGETDRDMLGSLQEYTRKKAGFLGGRRIEIWIV